MRAKAREAKRPKALSLSNIEVWDAAAIKALNSGEATPDQQKKALSWIIKEACGIGLISFDPDNSRATDFNEGKRFVGVQLVAILAEPLENFKKGKEKT